jgi:hypothetical protein
LAAASNRKEKRREEKRREKKGREEKETLKIERNRGIETRDHREIERGRDRFQSHLSLPLLGAVRSELSSFVQKLTPFLNEQMRLERTQENLAAALLELFLNGTRERERERCRGAREERKGTRAENTEGEIETDILLSSSLLFSSLPRSDARELELPSGATLPTLSTLAALPDVEMRHTGAWTFKLAEGRQPKRKKGEG